jgi:predicted ATPase
MEGKKLLHSIWLRNILSYGNDGEELQLEPLNVLIGPNASGKSNLIDAISLLAAAPRNFLAPLNDGGAPEDWLWKGVDDFADAVIEAAFENFRSQQVDGFLRYRVDISLSPLRPYVSKESLEDNSKEYFNRRAVGVALDPSLGGLEMKLDPRQSVLSQLKDPLNYPALTYVGNQLGSIRLFRGWPFGRGNTLRRPQGVNLPDDFLLEDGSNLGLILNDLQNRKATKRLLLEKLRVVYEGIEDVTTKTQGGTIQIFFHEEGLNTPVPAARLSDGTLHYLCLLTILLHPDPPPLICIEEPELGLHPDIIPHIADLLVDASKRTQLIVTTHSETLVSKLSDVPESIVVCERDDQGTHLRRLEPDKLRLWLDKYALGELWRMGELGGNRW